jgi:hypothetical protein
MTSSSFSFFYFKISQIFEISKFNQSIFGQPIKSDQISFIGFHENQLSF